MKKTTYLIFTLLLSSLSWQGMAQNYCEPENTSTYNNDYVSLVSSEDAILDINYSASSNEADYIDETGITLEVYPGQEFNLNTAYVGGTQTIGVWADWNEDGNFGGDNNTEERLVLSNGVSPQSFNVSIPASVDNGEYRFRVRGAYDYSGDIVEDGDDFSCNDQSYGTTVDFTIVVVDPPTCPKPTDLAVGDITENTADISWTLGNDEDEWDVLYGEAGFDPETEGTTITVNNDPQTTLSGLDNNTNYAFYVTAVCGIDDESTIAGPYVFRTACGVISNLPYTEDFDTYGTGAEAFPACWERITYTTGTNIWPSIVSQYATSGSNSLKFQSAEDTPSYAISPAFSEDIQDLRVTFMLKREGENSGTIDVGVMSDVNDTDTFELVQTINPADNNHTEYTFDLNQVSLSGSENYIALRHNSNSSVWYYWLDDFEVVLIPSCPEPSALADTVITDTTVDIEWAAGDAETSWSISWGTSGYTPGDSNEIDTAVATTTDYQITGLDAETIYDVYVQAECGEEDLSLWVGPLVVYTGYCLPTTTNNSAHIDSFTAEGDLGQNISNLDTGEGLDGNGYSDFSTQVVEVSGGGEIEITVEIDGSNTSGLKIWVDWDNNLVFDEESEIVYETTSYSASHSVTITVPTSEAGSYRMRVGSSYTPSSGPASACAHTGQGEFEDYTITVVSESESCAAPENITISSITADSADVTWTVSETAVDGYTVDVYEAGADISTDDAVFTELVAVGETTVEVTGLTPETNYDVYVTSDCGSGETAISDVVTFTTETIVCDGVTDVEVTDITAGEATVSWTASATAINGYTVGVFEAGADQEIDTPVFVQTVTADVTTITVTELEYLTSYDVYIAAHCSTEEPAISDAVTFTTEDIANVGDFEVVKLTVYPNPVNTNLNISAAKVIDEVQVYNILGQRVMTHKSNNTEVTLDVTELPTANYILKVRMDGIMSTVKFIKK